MDKIKKILKLSSWSDIDDNLKKYFKTKFVFNWLIIIPVIILTILIGSLQVFLIGLGIIALIYAYTLLNLVYVLTGKCAKISGVVVTSEAGNTTGLFKHAVISLINKSPMNQRPYVDVITEENSRIRVYIKGRNAYEVGNEVTIYTLFSNIAVKTEDFGSVGDYFQIFLEKYN